MKGLLKVGAVLVGYVASFIAGCVAVYSRQLLTQGYPADASGGMQAFGDAVLFLGVVGIAALFPTALALYYLRPYERFWIAFSVSCLVLSITGPFALVVHAFAGMFDFQHPLWVVAGFAELLRTAGAPLLAVAFLVCAVIAPARIPRRVLLTAAAIESAVSAYTFLHVLIMHRFP
jgi:hypothetical protein